MSEPRRYDPNYPNDPRRDPGYDPRRRDPDYNYDPSRAPGDWIPPATAERRATDVYTTPPPATLRRVSWGAIIAGSVVALSIQLMLNMLGLAIGFGSATPGADNSGLAVGAGIWLAIATIVSVFAGGWAAGRMSGLRRRLDGVLHGFVTWAMATFVAFYLVVSGAGALASGAMSVVQSGAQTRAGQQATDQAGGQLGGQIGDQARQLGGQIGDQARQLGQQMQQSADQILGTASSGATWAFVALLVGAIAGAAGGAVGAPKNLPPAPDSRREIPV